MLQAGLHSLIKQASADASRFPALEHLHLHSLCICIAAHKPKLMSVRMPSIEAEQVLQRTNQALIADGLLKRFHGAPARNRCSKSLLLEQHRKLVP